MVPKPNDSNHIINMKVSQLSEVYRITSNANRIILLYAPIRTPIPPQYEVETFHIRDSDDVKMILSLRKPTIYILPPTQKLEWETLHCGNLAYRVYDHPTTPNIILECLKGCNGQLTPYKSLWEAVKVLGKG